MNGRSLESIFSPEYLAQCRSGPNKRTADRFLTAYGESFIRQGLFSVNNGEAAEKYTYINNGQSLDVPKLLNGQAPYPKIQMGTNLYTPKKIVINDLNILNYNPSRLIKKYTRLIEFGFEIYVRTAPGVFALLSADSLEETVKKIRLAPKEEIAQELGVNNKAVDDYCILDHNFSYELLYSGNKNDAPRAITLQRWDELTPTQTDDLKKFLSKSDITKLNITNLPNSVNAFEIAQSVPNLKKLAIRCDSGKKHEKPNLPQLEYLKMRYTCSKMQTLDLSLLTNLIDLDYDKIRSNTLGSQESEKFKFVKTLRNIDQYKNENIKKKIAKSLAEGSAQVERDRLYRLKHQSSGSGKSTLNRDISAKPSHLDLDIGTPGEVLPVSQISFAKDEIAAATFDLHPKHARMHVLDELQYDGVGCTLIPTTPDIATLKKIDLQSGKESTKGCVQQVVELSISPGQLIPLPGLSAEDELLDIANPDLFNIFYSKENSQYYLQAKNDHYQNANFSYTIKPSASYWNTEITTATIADPKDFPALHSKMQLPKQIVMQLDKYFVANPELKFLKTKELSPVERAKHVMEFIHAFGFQKLSADEQQKGWIALLEAKTGACRHRSFLAVILCRYFNIPARMVTNHIHAFLEIAVNDGKKNYAWTGYDLGGLPSNTLVSTPNLAAIAKEEEEAKLAEAAAVEAELEQSRLPANKYSEKQLREGFFPLEAKLLKCPTKEIFIAELKKHSNILVTVENAEDAKRIYNELCQNEADPIIYIDNAAQIEALWTNNIIEDKECREIDGRLQALIKKREGMIVINWANFSANERAIYKCMLDKPPTLNNATFDKNIKVLSVLTQSLTAAAGEVFLSRCEELNWPKKYNLSSMPIIPPIKELILSAPPAETVVPFSVDLYGNANDWFRLLIGSPKIAGDEFLLTEGPLIKALKENKPIEIIRAPNDPEFHLFWHQLIADKAIWFNGEKIEFKNNFKIYSHEIAPDKKSNTSVEVLKEAPVVQPKNIFYINKANYSQLFEQSQIALDGKVYPKPSILEEYKAGDLIVLEDDLTAGQFEQLKDEATKKSPTPNHFKICVSPGFTIADEPDVWTRPTDPPTQNYKINISNDTQFTLNEIRQVLKKSALPLPGENIFYTREENTAWLDLIEKTEHEVKSVDGKKSLIFTHNLQPFLLKLMQGETVILNGHLALADYMQIKSLFLDKPYLYVNGERKEIKGRCIWIMPEKSMAAIPEKYLSNTPFVKRTVHPFAVDEHKSDYQIRLGAELNQNLDQAFINNIAIIFHKQKNIKGSKLPELTYTQFKAIYEAVKANKGTKDNPIKSILNLHYGKASAVYPYLNVISKMLFSTKQNEVVRREKILALTSRDDRYKNNFWAIANCLSAKSLRNLLPDIKNLEFNDTISDDLIRKLKSAIEIEIAKPRLDETNKKDDQRKQFKALEIAAEDMSDDGKPFICIMGPSGTGKTHAANHLPNGSKYNGLENINSWLTSKKSEPPHLLILDEANLEAAGKWEFLRGLCEVPPVVNYDGKQYPLTRAHKVIFTGNTLDYVGRHFHPILWEHANLIWFGPWKKNALEKQFLDKHLPRTFNDEDAKKLILNAYEFILKNNRGITEIGPRDLMNICTRLTVMQAQYAVLDNTMIEKILVHAVFEELIDLLPDETAQEAFKVHLGAENLNMLPAPPTLTFPSADKYYFTEKTREVWRIIDNDLAIRQLSIASDGQTSGKAGVLIEGASGIGKSKLFIEKLKAAGFHEYDPDQKDRDTQKTFYQITVGNKNVKQTLLDAFAAGSVVILDELNLSTEIEKLLNQLLSGRNEHGEVPSNLKPGFMVMASQNPPGHSGTKSLSTALRNRFHVISMQDAELNAQERENIAIQQGQPELALMYNEAKQSSWGKNLNQRVFLKHAAAAKEASQANKASLASSTPPPDPSPLPPSAPKRAQFSSPAAAKAEAERRKLYESLGMKYSESESFVLRSPTNTAKTPKTVPSSATRSASSVAGAAAKPPRIELDAKAAEAEAAIKREAAVQAALDSEEAIKKAAKDKETAETAKALASVAAAAKAASDSAAADAAAEAARTKATVRAEAAARATSDAAAKAPARAEAAAKADTAKTEATAKAETATKPLPSTVTGVNCNFLEKIKVYEKTLTGWTNDFDQVFQGIDISKVEVEVTFIKTGTSDSFVATQDKLTTVSQNTGTFDAMIAVYKASGAQGPPIVVINGDDQNQTLAKGWAIALAAANYDPTQCIKHAASGPTMRTSTQHDTTPSIRRS